ncbi:uncharacterized [Tachysurus ichikawai]
MAKCNTLKGLTRGERGGTAISEALHVLGSGAKFEKGRSSSDDILTRIIWSKGSKLRNAGMPDFEAAASEGRLLHA